MNSKEFLDEFDLKIKEFKRELVRENLNKCTEKQIDLFNRMYGNIEEIKEDKMRHAYNQCRRTLEKNKKGLEVKSESKRVSRKV